MELKQIKTLAILELLTKPNNNPDPKNKKQKNRSPKTPNRKQETKGIPEKPEPYQNIFLNRLLLLIFNPKS